MIFDELVSSKEELIASCVNFLALSESSSQEHLNYFRSRLRNIKRFVVLALDEQSYVFAPGSYVCYRGPRSIEQWQRLAFPASRQSGRQHLDAMLADTLIKEGHPKYKTLLNAYREYCSAWGVVPSLENRIKRSFWLLAYVAEAITLPQEENTYREGSVRSIHVNAYERDAAARLACIAHYRNRYCCEICGFDFAAVYGTLGKNYIQVHHLIPLARIRESYKVNPVTDLLPVCCNCHAMIHRRKDALLTPEELQNLVQHKASLKP